MGPVSLKVLGSSPPYTLGTPGRQCLCNLCVCRHVYSERVQPEGEGLERLNHHTHLLQLFYAGSVHHDLAGCTLSPRH